MSERDGSGSVVIPAHNEANLIGETLERLLADADPQEFETIVVCNGCSDNTAEAARRPGVEVIEIDQASKVAALNVGDSIATKFPRIYLDADVVIDTESLRAVIGAISAGAPAAAPLPVVDTRECSRLCRAYFAIWSRLGYATVNVLGSGVYALSEHGRARFAEFPGLIADDGFVYTHFAADERVNPSGATFSVRAPRTVRSLIRRRIRIVTGNLELMRLTGRVLQPPGPTWTQVARREPRLLPAVVTYASINAVSRIVARRRDRSGRTGKWNQDRTTREAKP